MLPPILRGRGLGPFTNGKFRSAKARARCRALCPQVEQFENRTLLSAVFVAEDAAAQGSWQGVYGAQGSALAGAATALPAWAQVAISGDYLYTWAATTTNPRGLQQPAPATGRAALAWQTWGTTTFDVNLTDGLTHDVSLYAVDWESLGRREQFQVTDAASGAVLDTEVLTNFSGGVYLTWGLSGHVLIRVTSLDAGGYTSLSTAVVSGLFLESGATAPPPPPPA